MPDKVYKIVIHLRADEGNSAIVGELNNTMHEFGFPEKIHATSHYTQGYISAERELQDSEIDIFISKYREALEDSGISEFITEIQLLPASAAETAAFLASDKTEAIS